jgi:hypothetical protein
MKSSNEKEDDPQVVEENVKLIVDKTEVEEDDEFSLSGIIKGNGCNLKKDQVDFVIFDKKFASFKEEEEPQGGMESNGFVLKIFQAKKQGRTSAHISATDNGADRELYAKIRLNATSHSSNVIVAQRNYCRH